MAASLRSYSTAQATPGTSVTVSPPSGLADGDILVLYLSWEYNGGTTVTPPTGFTAIRSEILIPGGGWNYIRLWWKRASSESGNYVTSFANSTQVMAILAAYSGAVASGTPWEDADSTTGSTTAITLPSIDTATANSLIVGFAGCYAWDKTFTSSALTERGEFNGNWFADVDQAATGASGTKAVTMSATDYYGGLIFNLIPASGGATYNLTASGASYAITAADVTLTYTPNAATILVNQGFEGTGYDNGETWTAYAGATGVANPDYTTAPIWGAQSLRMKDDGTEGTYAVTAFTLKTKFYGYFRIKVLDYPSSTYEILQTYYMEGPLETPTLAQAHDMIWISSSGVLQWRLEGGATANGTNALALNKVYNVWFYVDRSTTGYTSGWIKVSPAPAIPESNEITWTSQAHGNAYDGSNAIGFTTYHGAAYEYLADNLIVSDGEIGSQPGAGFVASGAAATGSTSLSVAYPSGLAAGDLLVLAIGGKGDVTPSTPSGWTAPSNNRFSGTSGSTGVDTGLAYAAAYYKVAAGTESGSLSVTITSGNSSVGRMFLYRKNSASTWSIATHGAGDSSAGTSWSVTAGGDPGVTAGDVILAASGINTDGYTFASQAISQTGISAWGTMYEYQDSGTTTGNDCKLVVSAHDVGAGTGSAAPVYTMTSSGSATNAPAGGTVLLRIRALRNMTLAATGRTHALTGADVTLTYTPASGAYTITAEAASLAFTGAAAALVYARIMAGDGGAYTLTGADAGLFRRFSLSAAGSSYALTGSDAGLIASRILGAAAGSFATTGTDAGIILARVLGGSAGAYSLTLSDAGLVYTQVGGYTLTAEAASLTLTGAAASLTYARIMAGGAASYALTLQSASLIYTQVGAYALSAEAGVYTLTLQDAGVIAGRMLGAGAGAYSLTALDASLARGLYLASGGSSYALSAADAGLLVGRVLAADAGVIALTGLDVLLLYSLLAGVPIERVYSVAADYRAYSIGVDARNYAVIAENRVYNAPSENRRGEIPLDDRTLRI